MKRIDWLIIFFVIIISTIALKDLFKPGFFTSHDGIFHIARQYYFDQALKDGQIPPRWAGGALNNFGYPLFIFEYHLPYAFGEIFHVFGVSLEESVKGVLLLGYIISGISMYFMMKEKLNRLPAFVGSILYLVAPYRFQTIFVRAALGEATAYMFLPLIFLFIFKILKSNKFSWKYITLGALSIAGLILSNLTVFLIAIICVFIYMIFVFPSHKNKKRLTLSFLLMFLFGILVTSYYFIPAAVEQAWTNYSGIINNKFIEGAFLTFSQLIYSKWGYSWMGAAIGKPSYQVGIAQWIIVVLAVGLVVFKLITGKKNKLLLEVTAWLVLFIFSLFMMLSISLPVWKLFSILADIQFPFRFLYLAIFSSALLGGYLIFHIKAKLFRYFLSFIIIFIAFYTNRNYLRINQTLNWPLAQYLKVADSGTSFGEFTPKWVNLKSLVSSGRKVESLRKDSKISILQNKSNRLAFVVNSSGNDTIRINTIYYPGWNISVNGKKVEINYQNGGLIKFPVERGSSMIIAQFGDTPLRLISNLISILSFSFLFIKLLPGRKSHSVNHFINEK